MSNLQLFILIAAVGTALGCWCGIRRVVKREVRRAYLLGYGAGLEVAAEHYRRNLREALGVTADGVISIPPSGTRPS